MNTNIQKEMRNTKNNVNLVGSSDMQFSTHMWVLLMYNYMLSVYIFMPGTHFEW